VVSLLLWSILVRVPGDDAMSWSLISKGPIFISFLVIIR
jgi:hypothetical protein